MNMILQPDKAFTLQHIYIIPNACHKLVQDLN